MAFVRGSNPIWAEFDLTGKIFDDTFYLFVLQNTLPYLPATVYHDSDGNLPWTNPIRFLANGTLPVDVFFDPGTPSSPNYYRLEFRQGNTQADPLIYLVENYAPGGGSSAPSGDSGLVSDNQISNPQFSLLSFQSPFSLTSATNPDPIEVAPGWFLLLTGTGNVTLTRVPLDDSLTNPTNAPYALQITLSGTWTDAKLRQRFEQNGILWANKVVSSSVMARISGSPQSISADLIDSNGTTLAEVLAPVQVNSTFAEYLGYGQLGASTNPDVPPAAYVDYLLNLPTSVDIFVTSFQLVAQNSLTTFNYEQTTVERQVDHLFHYYRDSIILQPKESILTGWDFGLNPWQSRTTTSSNFSSFGYAADQTFVVQQRYVEVGSTDNVKVGQSSAATNSGFLVTPVTSTNEFAIGQFIDPSTVRPYWGSTFSSLVKLRAQRQNTSIPLRVKMRLIYRSSLPSTLARFEPIAVWAPGTDPTYAAGWTAIVPKNDPVYDLSNGLNTLTFEGMTLPASASADMTLGILIYTLDPMIETGTPDNINFNRVSLVPNAFAIDSNVLTFDETLRRCQFYYEKSYPLSILPGASSLANIVACPQRLAAGVGGKPSMFYIQYNTRKRSGTPIVNLYNYNGSAAGVVLSVLYSGGAPTVETPTAIANWTKGVGGGDTGQIYTAATTTTIVAGVGDEAFIAFQYSCNARLGD